MRNAIFLMAVCCLFWCLRASAQSGAGLKSDERHQRYFDSIRNSDYKWTFPIYGKKLSKKGFDIPYPWGIMLNSFIASQEVLISDLKVGINGKEQVPLDFVKFGDVSANAQTVLVRPDLWVLPFLDVYGIAGFTRAKTRVSIAEPLEFSTDAEFKGYSLGMGVTLAGGYHRLIFITDFNITWSRLDNIEGFTMAKNISTRAGMNFRLPKAPDKSIAYWLGAQGIFINRTTEGVVDLSDLRSNAPRSELEDIVNELPAWYRQLSPDRREVVRALAKHTLDKINGDRPAELTVSYSLIKKPVSNWSMLAGGQFQFNHHWQARAEFGFLGGRKSGLFSVNYRFR